MEEAASPDDKSWHKLEGICVHCGEGDFTPEYGPRHFVLCSCCNNRGTHVECFERNKGHTLTEEFINSGSSWFCGKGCEEIADFFETQNGVRAPIRGEAAEYTLEIVRYDPDSRGARSVVDAAVRIFRDAFGRMKMPNGKDYIEMCCTAYESPDDELGSDSEDEENSAVDFTGFRIAALRKGNQVVTVSTLRLFGTQLAEMPYVATRSGFRRAGHCRRLLKGVEDMLRKLKVRWLVLPSIKSILTMWRYSFNFMPLTLEELASLEAHIISPDFGTVQLLKKRMWPPIAGQRVSRGSRGSRGSCVAAAATAVAAVAAGDSKIAGQGEPGCGRGRASGRGAGAARGSRGRQLQLKFGVGRRRRSRTAAASGCKGDDSISDVDGESSSDGEHDEAAESQHDEQSKAAAEERAAAEAAWAMFEQEKQQKKGQQGSSSSDESDKDSSSDEESNKAAKRCSRKRRKAGKPGADDGDYKGNAGSSSDSSGSESGLVSEDDDIQHISKRKLQQHHKRDAAATSAGTATASGSADTAAAAAAAGSAAESSSLPTQADRDAVLHQLRKEVEKAGGKLSGGWTVRLVGKTPTGNWRTKHFVAPGGAPVVTGILAVKRHLGLVPPLPGNNSTQSGVTPAAVAAPCRKRQCIAGPDAGGGNGAAGSGAVQYPQSVAKRLCELRLGRARRRHMTDATIGVGLADAVKTFYTTAVTQLTSIDSRQQMLELQQQVESLQTQLHGCYSAADLAAVQLSSCSIELAAVKAERDVLQAARDAYEHELVERSVIIRNQHAVIRNMAQQLQGTAAAVAEQVDNLPETAEMKAANTPPLPGAANSVTEQDALVMQLRQLLATKDAELAVLKQQMEPAAAAAVAVPLSQALLSSSFAAEVGAAGATAPLSPHMLAGSVAAQEAGADQQGRPGHISKQWDCQEALKLNINCSGMHELCDAARDGLDVDMTIAEEAAAGAVSPVPAADDKLFNPVAAACQMCGSSEPSQQYGTQTLQFSEEQVADGVCDTLSPARQSECFSVQQEQEQQRQQQQCSIAVLGLVTASAGTRAGALAAHKTAATTSAAAEAEAEQLMAAAPSHTAASAVPAAEVQSNQERSACVVNAASLPVSVTAAAKLGYTTAAAAPPQSSNSPPAATAPCKPSGSKSVEAVTASVAATAVDTSHLKQASLQQLAAVVPATGNVKPSVISAAETDDSKGTAQAAAVTTLRTSKPPPDPTAAAAIAAAAPGSGGSRLSDSFLSGILPDVVRCLIQSPAPKQAAGQQQSQHHQQQQSQHQQQQQPESPETEQPSGGSKGQCTPSALKTAGAAPRQPPHSTTCYRETSTSAAAASPAPVAEPVSDEASFDPDDMEQIKSPSAPADINTPTPAAAITTTPVLAQSVEITGRVSGSNRKCAADPTPNAGQDAIAAVSTALTTPLKFVTRAAAALATTADSSQQSAEKRQKLHHHRYRSSRSGRRTSNAVLDLFGDVALLEGLQELHSPGSSSNPDGKSSSGGSGASGGGGGGTGSEGTLGAGSGSSVMSGNHPGNLHGSSAPSEAAAPAAAIMARRCEGSADSVAGAVVPLRETTPEEGCAEDAAAADKQQQTPSSDGGDLGLPGGLAELFEHLAADMARDGMLPGGALLATAQQALPGASNASSGSSRLKGRGMPSVLGSVINTAAVGIGKVAGSMVSAEAAWTDRGSGVAEGTTTVAGVSADVVGSRQDLKKSASTAVEGNLSVAGSVPAAAEENVAAALDTAALFAFAGDLE